MDAPRGPPQYDATVSRLPLSIPAEHIARHGCASMGLRWTSAAARMHKRQERGQTGHPRQRTAVQLRVSGFRILHSSVSDIFYANCYADALDALPLSNSFLGLFMDTRGKKKLIGTVEENDARLHHQFVQSDGDSIRIGDTRKKINVLIKLGLFCPVVAARSKPERMAGS